MKKRFKLKVGGSIMSGILLFALVLTPEVRKAGAWKIKELRRDKYDYPTSKTFLDVGGKPYPLLEGDMKEKIFIDGDEVLIAEGDVPFDAVKFGALTRLSPVIRMHPEASSFRMTWSIHVAQHMNDAKLNYNRDKGQVTLTQTSTNPPGSPHTKLLGKYLTDRDIHEAGLDAAKNLTEFEDWAAKHWDR